MNFTGNHRPSLHPTLKTKQIKAKAAGKPDPEPEPVLWRSFPTLIKYDPPRITSPRKKKEQSRMPVRFDLPSRDDPPPRYTPTCRKQAFESIQNAGQLTEAVLNTIIPPKRWTDDFGANWVQMVSNKPATRADVMKLSESLERVLQDGKAKESGIDHFRRKVFTELFDELIRQCTIQCAEHGMLLFRIRNEIQMTLRSYESLYESGTAFALRKVLMAQEEKETGKMQEVEEAHEIQELQATAEKLRRKLESGERKFNEMKEIHRAKLKEEFDAKKLEQEATKMAIWSALFPKNNVTPVI